MPKMKKNFVEDEIASKDERTLIQRDQDFLIKDLQNLLNFYRTSKGEILKLNQLISQDEVLKTNQDLLYDAVKKTKDLQTWEEINNHRNAQVILLIWCMIYCERVLAKRYRGFAGVSEKSQEDIACSVKAAVLKCYEAVKKDLNGCISAVSEGKEERTPFNPKQSLRAYMLGAANYKAVSEHYKTLRSATVLQEVSPQKARELEETDEFIVEKGGKFYLRKFKYVPATFTDKENGKEYDNPSLTRVIVEDIVEGAEKYRDQYILTQKIDELIDLMYQKGDLSELEMEFLTRAYIKGEKFSDIASDWQEQNRELPYNSIYNFHNNILKKMRKTIENTESLAALTQLRLNQ